jgi:hypothetical protein
VTGRKFQNSEPVPYRATNVLMEGAESCEAAKPRSRPERAPGGSQATGVAECLEGLGKEQGPTPGTTVDGEKTQAKVVVVELPDRVRAIRRDAYPDEVGVAQQDLAWEGAWSNEVPDDSPGGRWCGSARPNRPVGWPPLAPRPGNT